MTCGRTHEEIEVAQGEEELPLVAADSACGAEDVGFEFDEHGALSRVYHDPTIVSAVTAVQPLQPAVVAGPITAIPLSGPCSLGSLNGSWLLEILPTTPSIFQLRGPMRIEASQQLLRISGDIYLRKLLISTAVPVAPNAPVVANPLIIKKNWYPAFPQSEYRWYFRSLGVSYLKGKLVFKFERHLWSTSQQEFIQTDTGSMEFTCNVSLIKPVWAPQPTLKMTGTANIGGQKYNVTATKTSPYYRGCLVEVDVMTNRQFPASATSCDGGQTHTFTGVYRTSAGMDFRAVVNEVNVPEDPVLSTAEMHNLLATHRSLSAGGDNWHLWLLVGSRMDGTLGIMFDTGNPPHREGAVGFYDPTLSNIDIIMASARGKKLGEVPLAFLRTLIHEAGHAFNLYHPKHDIHGIPVSTTIMNQTGDVMGFATAANPYPCNATMAFNEHNRTSLIHSPDPQVKPGWKEFGWGHGSAWSGIAEPVDALGIDQGYLVTQGMRLDLRVPGEARRGEFVWANITVTNTDDMPRLVTSALNLSEGDLKIDVTPPNGCSFEARDVVVVCGDRRFVELQPGESITGQVQLFYTPRGLTFDQPGTYEFRAELDVGDPMGGTLRSEPVQVVIKPAVTDQERELERLAMDPAVGLSLALGDIGTDTAALDKLTTLVDRFPKTDTGAASAMVVVNSLARDLRDVRTGRVIRPADEAQAGRALDAALKGRDAANVASLAAAVVSPRETSAPLLDRVQTSLKKARKGTYAEEDIALAGKILSDHLS